MWKLWIVKGSGVLFLVLFFIAVSANVAQELSNLTPQHKLSLPIKQINYEKAFIPGYPLPKWSNGYLVAWKSNTSASDTGENLTLYDQNGVLIGRTRIWLEDASLIRIIDGAVRSDGRVAAVGWALTGSGTIAFFLADVSVTQGTGHVITTSPFEGQAVTFGPDGTIWVMGLQTTGAVRKVKRTPDHYIVEHFGEDDVLKGGHLPVSSISCPIHPVLQDNGIPHIVASKDRIGLLSPACSEWIELGLDGALLGQWKWQDDSSSKNNSPTRLTVRTVAMTSANDVYARVDTSAGIGLFHFDYKSSRWLPVDMSEVGLGGTPFLWLQGSDDDKLVYLTSGHKLAWSKPSGN